MRWELMTRPQVDAIDRPRAVVVYRLAPLNSKALTCRWVAILSSPMRSRSKDLSPSGFGDPGTASAVKRQRIFTICVEETLAFIHDFANWKIRGPDAGFPLLTP